MKLIYKITFILCLFLLTLGINIQGVNLQSANYAREGAVYSINQIESDLSSNIKNETIFAQNLNQNLQNSARTKLTSGDNGFYNAKIIDSDLSKIIAYIYTKSYLDNIKNKNLLLISSSIKPNAP